jgi:hypothetical protein
MNQYRWPLLFVVCSALLGVGVWWLVGGSRDAPKSADRPSEQAPSYFADVTKDSGVDFTYRNGEEADRYTILESLGGGVAMLDFDGDGLLDLFLPGGGDFTNASPPKIVGRPGKCFRNLGNFRFQDVTSAVGLEEAPFYTHGVAVCDFDGDGFPDLLLTGYGGLRLYHNVPEGKGRRFRDVSEWLGFPATPQAAGWTTSAAWGDLFGNGRADLYVCRYLDWSFANDPRCTSKADPKSRDICDPRKFQPQPHLLFRKEGERWKEVAKEVGLRNTGRGLGVVIADLDDDGRPDLYVANDASENHLYLAQGKGKFRECGESAGVAVDDYGRYNGSMGVDVGDYDGSQRPSLWVTNYQGELHALYQNLGKGRFSYQSNVAGLGVLGQEFVGFGTGFLDLDNDGWLDLLIVNGHVLRHPAGATFRQKPVLLHNRERNARRFFADISKNQCSTFSSAQLGRGVAIGDLDNDGRADVVISHSNSPVTLLRNVGESPNWWVGIELRGRNRRVIAGAKVNLEMGERTLTRFAKGGGSYLSASDPRMIFGLGRQNKIERVIVRWPHGATEEFKDLKQGSYQVLSEGAGTRIPERPGK